MFVAPLVVGDGAYTGAGRQLAFEAAADLGCVDARRADEGAALGDLDDAAVHAGLDAALDHQGVAISDLDSLQLDVAADDELAALGLRRRGTVAGAVGLRRWAEGGQKIGRAHV